MQQSNKGIENEIVNKVTAQFNEKCRAHRETMCGELVIVLKVANVPQSVIKKIDEYVRQCDFKVWVSVKGFNTPSYQETINNKCAEMGFPSFLRHSNIDDQPKETCYLQIHQNEAHEIIFQTAKPQIVITPQYKQNSVDSYVSV